jgi:hypothetical protein
VPIKTGKTVYASCNNLTSFLMQGFTFSVHPEALENADLCVSILTDSGTQVCFTPRPP